MQDKTILITRPNYELTTRYLYHWATYTIQIGEKKCAKIIDLAGDKVTRKEFEGRAKKMLPNFIFLNGHGSKDEVTGHDYEVILDGSNANLTDKTVVYALSCDSAANLGPIAVSKGAQSYIGYKESFVFATEDHKSTKPLKDKSAELFLKPAMQVAGSLLKGKSAAEAVAKGRDAFSGSIIKAASSEVQSGYDSYIRYLLWDRECLTYSGNGNAKV